MILRFATNMDRNGNRYYLILDCWEKKFSVVPSHWFNRYDFIIVTKTELRKIKEQAKTCNYTETDNLY